MFDAGVLIFPQGLPAVSNLLTNAALAVEIETVFACAADAEL